MEYEIFSKRQQRIQGETTDTDQYESIPQKLRVQVLYIWNKVWGKADYNDYFDVFQLSELARDAYNSIEMTLREEYGVRALDEGSDPDDASYSVYEAVRDFLLKTENTDKVIDVIEVSFRYIDQVIQHDGIPPDEAIDLLNRRFREHNVEYQYKSGQIEKVDSQDIHSEVVKPAEDGITEVDMSKPDLLEHEFHPAISSKVWSVFSNGAYDTAVFEAFKQVEIAVRKAGGYAEADIGVKLMRKAFNVKNGDLTDPEQQESEKEARFFLFVGAIGAYKNPSSHRDVEITAEEAIEMIAFASYLHRIVDSRNQSDGDWQEQFANGFVRHLESHKSPLMDPTVFVGKNFQGYPRYIGFNIRRVENLDLRDRDAFWLAASTAHSGKIYLKLHMNDSNYFSQLESQKAAIEHEFGNLLKWEPQCPGQYIRIGVDIEVNPLDENRGQWNQHFENMREKLEKLNEIFQSRIEDAFSDDDIPF